MKLRDTRVGLLADGSWLAGRLHHSPRVEGIVLLLGAGAPPDPLPAPDIIDTLHVGDYATLDLDLLTERESERDPDAAFNVPLLANRVLAAADWAIHQPDLAGLPTLLVARGTACGAAVRAAWKAPQRFAALVCLGGRPDLAGAAPLAALDVPARLIVAFDDGELAIVQRAAEELGPDHELCVIGEQAPSAESLTRDWLDRWRDVPRDTGDDPPDPDGDSDLPGARLQG